MMETTLEKLSDQDKQNIRSAEKRFSSLENPTWNDFSDLINTNPHCSKDEGGVHPFESIDLKDFKFSNKPILDSNPNALASYWVVGGSEGYYVHVRPVISEGRRIYGQFGTPEMIGKFWSKDTAEACSNYIQRMSNRFIR